MICRSLTLVLALGMAAPLVAAPQGQLLGGLNEAAGALGVFLYIQGNSPFAATVLPIRHRSSRSKR